ncbi:MAG TPA: hypothetical protein VIO61_00205 [Anaerolineaceae bacterium]
MIELPEAVVISQQITDSLGGRTITRAIANQSPHKFAWFSGDPANYNALLAGKTIQTARAVGNACEIHASGMLLVISTPIFYHAPGAKLPLKHQLLLELDNQGAVTCTVQMWGGLLCFPEGEPGGMTDYQVALQKPSPLSAEFTLEYFQALAVQSDQALSAKAFLATEQRIPGLGNGVLQDILWTAKIHPRRRLDQTTCREIAALYAAIRFVLSAMVEQGGRDTERDLFGNPGGYQTILSKNTVNKPCPACGETIVKEAYLGGSIYFCPACQK